jgi:hypothetical protein
MLTPNKSYIKIALLFLVMLTGKGWGQAHLYTDINLSSPAIAIDDFDSDWSDVDSGRFAQAQVRTGIEFSVTNTWLVGVEERLDYLLHFTQATAQFNQKLESNDLEAGEYPLWLRVNAVRSSALSLKKFIPLSNDASLEITGYALKPKQVQDGLLKGSGEVYEDGSYQYSYSLDYAYDRNELFEHQGSSIEGWGHSFDLSFNHTFEQWHYSLKLKDLGYRVYWQAVNQDQGCYSRPLGDCFFTTKSVSQTQKLPFSQQHTLTMNVGASRSLYVQAYEWSRLQALRFGGQLAEYSLAYDLLSQATHFGYESDMVRFKLASDQYDLSKTKYWQASVDFYWPIL